MKTEIKKYQQGDVIIKETKELKKNWGKKLNHLILQQSDVSSNKHKISKGNALLFEGKNKDEFYLDVKEDVTLVHEEHKSIVIPKGKYFVYGVKEYDPFEDEIRRVLD